MLLLLKEHLVRAQHRMKSIVDRHRRNLSFKIGDMVYLKSRLYRQLSLARKVNEKLSPRFYYPFPILQCVGQVAYKLQVPTSSTIHPVFHISQLRPIVGNVPPYLDLPTHLSVDLELLVELEDMLGYRIVGPSIPYDVEVLIKWKDLPAQEAT